MTNDYQVETVRPPWPKEDKRPMRDGWAPGDYFCTCFACKKQFIGDKRAVQCADCAYQ